MGVWQPAENVSAAQPLARIHKSGAGFHDEGTRVAVQVSGRLSTQVVLQWVWQSWHDITGNVFTCLSYTGCPSQQAYQPKPVIPPYPSQNVRTPGCQSNLCATE